MAKELLKPSVNLFCFTVKAMSVKLKLKLSTRDDEYTLSRRSCASHTILRGYLEAELKMCFLKRALNYFFPSNVFKRYVIFSKKKWRPFKIDGFKVRSGLDKNVCVQI